MLTKLSRIMSLRMHKKLIKTSKFDTRAHSLSFRAPPEGALTSGQAARAMRPVIRLMCQWVDGRQKFVGIFLTLRNVRAVSDWHETQSK